MRKRDSSFEKVREIHFALKRVPLHLAEKRGKNGRALTKEQVKLSTLDYSVFRNIALRCFLTWKGMQIAGCVLLLRELERRITIWRANRKLAKLVNTYVKTVSKHKESYEKQLNKLQELLTAESVDELTYERMRKALENDHVQKLEEAKMRLSSTQDINTPSADAGIQ